MAEFFPDFEGVLMIKFLPYLLLLVSSFVGAKDLYSDIDGDGIRERFIERRSGDISVIDFYEGNVLIDKYTDVTQYFPSFDSRFVKSPADGISIVINTDASRAKYKTIIPIKKRKNKLYFTCAYNVVYDAVDMESSAGVNCGNGSEHSLTRENFESVMSGFGLKKFSKKSLGIRKIKKDMACYSPEGLEYGKYFILRCARLTKSSQLVNIYVFERNKLEPIFSVEGLDFVPSSDGSSFALTMIDDKFGAVVVKGSLRCFGTLDGERKIIYGAGFINKRSAFKYNLEESDGCLIGSYSYDKFRKSIALKGANVDGKYYLMEYDGLSSKVGAFFVLDELLNSKIEGEWLSFSLLKNYSISTH